jgi:hypothetical protein
MHGENKVKLKKICVYTVVGLQFFDKISSGMRDASDKTATSVWGIYPEVNLHDILKFVSDVTENSMPTREDFPGVKRSRREADYTYIKCRI